MLNPETIMKTQNSRTHSEKSSKRSRRFLILLGSVLIFVLAISCETIHHIVVAPPQIPGATFIGSQECATCHEDETKAFKFAAHSRLQAKGKNTENRR